MQSKFWKEIIFAFFQKIPFIYWMTLGYTEKSSHDTDDHCERPIGLMSREFANGPGDRGSIPGRVYTKELKKGTWYLLA